MTDKLRDERRERIVGYVNEIEKSREMARRTIPKELLPLCIEAFSEKYNELYFSAHNLIGSEEISLRLWKSKPKMYKDNHPDWCLNDGGLLECPYGDKNLENKLVMDRVPDTFNVKPCESRIYRLK